jgi:CheY-like chemotaxis protein
MARKSILVVDDEKGQREILEEILSDAGYDVTTASSA